MFQNLLAIHIGNFVHDLISYWNFSMVPRDSQGLGELGPPTLLCLYRADLALSDAFCHACPQHHMPYQLYL